jgi:hypothetical protein
MAAATTAGNMVTVSIVQVELRTDRRTNDYSVVAYQAREGFESADGKSEWCDLDDIRPPLGFVWATGGMWSVPDSYTTTIARHRVKLLGSAWPVVQRRRSR